jgi:hypothetical protein
MTTPAPAVPAQVRNATYAVWALLGLIVLRLILTIALKDDLVDKYIEGNRSAQSLPPEIAEGMAPSYTGVAIVSLVLAGILAAAAVFLPKGASWAKVVAIVFASLSVLGVVMSLVAPTLPVLLVINLLSGAASIAVIVLLVSGPANRFFAK